MSYDSTTYSSTGRQAQIVRDSGAISNTGRLPHITGHTVLRAFHWQQPGGVRPSMWHTAKHDASSTGKHDARGKQGQPAAGRGRGGGAYQTQQAAPPINMKQPAAGRGGGADQAGAAPLLNWKQRLPAAPDRRGRLLTPFQPLLTTCRAMLWWASLQLQRRPALQPSRCRCGRAGAVPARSGGRGAPRARVRRRRRCSFCRGAAPSAR